MVTQSSHNSYILMASEADCAVVIKKGPGKWCFVLKWDLATDVVEPGHWFRGKIFPHRSGLSPSGKYLIYFAGDWRDHIRKNGVPSTWTAISRPPYLTALTLWPEGTTWGGGGFFLKDNHVVLRTGHMSPHPDFSIPKKMKVSVAHWEDLEPNDGWFRKDKLNKNLPAVSDEGLSFKQATDTRYAARKYLEKDSYILEGTQLHKISGASCIEVDHQGRVLIAAQGRLYALPRDVPYEGLRSSILVADISGYEVETKPAPKEMTQWS